MQRYTRRTATVTGLLLTAVAVGACCGPTSAGAPAAGSSPTGPAGQTAAPAVNLDFTARTITGATFNGHQLAGKPAVLWFWAPWCPTCRAQSGWVSALAEKYAGKVNVVGVGGLDESGAIRDFGSKLTTFPQLDDARGQVWTQFGVIVQSSYVVLDRNGRVQFQGYLDNDELDRRVAQLVS
ncbi:MAG: redoxin domain-containing protein [Kribbellaceae bacterium]|nr:redoxin domain-containing protein [Catenulispora sp.]NUR98812.1 redoxin domain-containing protein [Kribbellaceae bacterium]